MSPLVDSFGRVITYMRIAVTDRCNLRCVYCLPPEGVAWKKHEEILTFEEIATVVAAAARLGVRRLRLTGGEPLVRRNLPVLVNSLAQIPGIEEVGLTTNGVLLGAHAQELSRAGLRRVNVSLDTLRADRYERISRGGKIDQVWEGIAAAEAAGLVPIKINTVAIRGLNDDELVDLARLTLDRPWHVRIIELMPVGDLGTWGPELPNSQDGYLPVAEIRKLLAPLRLVPEGETQGAGPARVFRIPGARGTIGLISPLGEHFCDRCNRLRLTADGFLRPCLLGDREVEVRGALRRGESMEPLIQRAVALKPEKHELSEDRVATGRWMAQIGG